VREATISSTGETPSKTNHAKRTDKPKRRPQIRCRRTLIHPIPTSSPFQELSPRSSFSKNLIPESIVFELSRSPQRT
jgi:hypothetical protein